MVAQKEKNRRDLGTILSAHNVGIPNGQKASVSNWDRTILMKERRGIRKLVPRKEQKRNPRGSTAEDQKAV